LNKSPDYIIIGAQRSGTTTLQALINQHPDASATLGGVREELHYFAWHRRYAWGLDWYKSRFPDCKVAGEKSPMYLQHPLVPMRIELKHLHTTKFIAVLRNPIDRAWSNWFKAKAKGFVEGRFMAHCTNEDGLLTRELVEHGNFWGQYFWGSHHHLRGILARGKYVEQLGEWLDRFGRDRVMVIQSERLFGNQHGTISQVYKFLGLDNFKPVVKHKQKFNYSKMPKSTRKWLTDYYRLHNLKLYDLIGEDYGWK